MIVVGYDGSPSSRAALRLGLDRLGSDKLFLVHASPAAAELWGAQQHDRLLEAALDRGEALLAEAARVEPRLTDADHELD